MPKQFYLPVLLTLYKHGFFDSQASFETWNPTKNGTKLYWKINFRNFLIEECMLNKPVREGYKYFCRGHNFSTLKDLMDFIFREIYYYKGLNEV